MSDISMPPEPPKPENKHFLDKPVVKSTFAFFGFVAPLPVLLVLINLWLKFLASPELSASDPFTIFRQIFAQVGYAPMWLAPLSTVPSLILLMVLFRSAPTRFAALLGLIFSTAIEVFVFLQTGF